MIHEIFPKLLDNHYEQKVMAGNSFVLSFKEDAVLFGDDPNAHTQFPLCSELDLIGQEAIYLFEVDGSDFFLSQPEDIKTHPGYSYQRDALFRTMHPEHLAFAGITARHLNTWYNSNQYCGKCGNHLTHSQTERMLFCTHCGNTVYPKISPVIIVGIYKGDELLLTKYAGREYTNYALVAGFIEIGESVEDAIRREVKEEVGLQIKSPKYYKSQPWGFSESLLLGYFAELDGDSDIVLDTYELSEAAWIHRNDIHIAPDNLSLTNEMITYFKNAIPNSNVSPLARD